MAALLAVPDAGDAVTDAVDLAELLDVDVEQLARLLALVTDDGRLRVERAELTEPEPAQHAADGRNRAAELAGNRRAGPALPPQRLDCGLGRRAQPGRAVVRREERSTRPASPSAA